MISHDCLKLTLLFQTTEIKTKFYGLINKILESLQIENKDEETSTLEREIPSLEFDKLMLVCFENNSETETLFNLNSIKRDDNLTTRLKIRSICYYYKCLEFLETYPNSLIKITIEEAITKIRNNDIKVKLIKKQLNPPLFKSIYAKKSRGESVTDINNQRYTVSIILYFLLLNSDLIDETKINKGYLIEDLCEKSYLIDAIHKNNVYKNLWDRKIGWRFIHNFIDKFDSGSFESFNSFLPL